MCAFSQELVFSFHLQDGVITVVNIQADVKTPFIQSHTEQVSPMGINLRGYSRTQILPYRDKKPSVCLLEVLYRSDSAHCCGLRVNLTAYTNLGLTFRAHLNLHAL